MTLFKGVSMPFFIFGKLFRFGVNMLSDALNAAIFYGILLIALGDRLPGVFPT
mgnify:CR=1 FL=1